MCTEQVIDQRIQGLQGNPFGIYTDIDPEVLPRKSEGGYCIFPGQGAVE